MINSCRERGNGGRSRRKMKGGEEQRGGRPLPADEVLILLTDVLLRYLEQLKDARAAGENSFLYGEQTAYTECLEWIGLWEHAAEHGIDFDIEKCYPL